MHHTDPMAQRTNAHQPPVDSTLPPSGHLLADIEATQTVLGSKHLLKGPIKDWKHLKGLSPTTRIPSRLAGAATSLPPLPFKRTAVLLDDSQTPQHFMKEIAALLPLFSWWAGWGHWGQIEIKQEWKQYLQPFG